MSGAAASAAATASVTGRTSATTRALAASHAPARESAAHGSGGAPAPLLTAGALITTALLAGLYYGWAVSVMPGLARTDDATFVESVQEMNAAILNPAFLVALAGAPALSVAAYVAWRRRRGADRSRRVGQLLLAALALNVAGLLLTVGGNVPLNDRLAAFGDPRAAQSVEVAAAREAFEGPWTRRHLLRTALTVGALGALTGAALLDRRAA